VKGALVFKRLVDVLRFRPIHLRWLGWRMLRLSSSATGRLLHVLLKALKLAFLVDAEFRQDIDPFEATYHFTDRDGKIQETAAFHSGCLTISRRLIGQADAKLTFKNSKALADFLFSQRPDLLQAMLKQDVTPEGNLNYLYKLAYMANHLRLRFMPS
jgi:hypothetical protein